MKTSTTKWYVAKTGNHQGLIVCEETGANIAVAYDKKDAPILAAGPDMLAALESFHAWLICPDTSVSTITAMRNTAAAAIAKAIA